jgi:hypothetical protein
MAELYDHHEDFAVAHDALPVGHRNQFGKEFKEAMEEEFDGPFRVMRRRRGEDSTMTRGYQGIDLRHWSEALDDEDE